MKSTTWFMALGVWGLAVSAWAQVPEREREVDLSEVIVTGSLIKVTQGGVKDINFFRGEVTQDRIPHPDTITAEGLFSNYDLQLTGRPCQQLFCLLGEATPVSLIAQPEAEHLVALSFASNVEADKWRRPPLNLIAVVDKSGSMDGEPLELVRRGLENVVKRLRSDDQISVVLYGDRSYVHLQTTKIVGRGRADAIASIKAIASAGSTNMESGLRLGYEVAANAARGFNGITRLMLFTDEQPNVGATDAESFMGMAIAGSQRGFGLTTIGVGVQFDAPLATKISSVRGGNSFFMSSPKDADELFATELDYMVSELAHDVRIVIAPHSGYRVTGVYGVPGQLLGWQDDANVAITIPTVFLSTKGGGLFVALGRRPNDKNLPPPQLGGEPLASIDLSFLPLSAQTPLTDSLSILGNEGGPSKALRLGTLLVDEFTVLRQATTEHYLHHNPRGAYRLLSAMSARLKAANEPLLKPEISLVGSLEERFAFLGGYGGEGKFRKTKFAQLWGKWEVTRRQGQVSMYPKDILEFTAEDEFKLTRGRPHRDAEDEQETYRANNGQIYLNDSELVFEYRVSGDSLVLTHQRSGVRVHARRVAEQIGSLERE